MEDSQIIQLYWNRDQAAIPATSQKYGNYCLSIAQNILGNSQDAEECVNDTFLNAWNTIPPHRPNMLSTFLGKITRNLSFNRYKYNHAEKRGNGEIHCVLDELAECVSDTDDVEQEIDRRELVKEINIFLESLPSVKRDIFVGRYWYADGVQALAKRFKMTDNNVSVLLNRTRKQLKTHLSERGFEL